MKKIIVFIIALIVAFIPGILGSLFTTDAVNSSWYLQSKPSFTPPNYVFPIAWTILYLLIGISLYLTWTNAKTNQKKKVAIVFGINLFFNALWSIFFFGFKLPAIAFIDIALIWITIIAMISVSYKINKKAAWILAPYLLWVSFAGFLNLAFL